MSLFVLAFAFASGCSDGATATDVAADASEDTTTDAPVDSTTDSGVDTEVVDSSAPDTAKDTSTVDTGTPVDTGVGESGGVLFACGSVTCSSSFQYCSRARAPGICPKIDSGVCPAGCPGCPPLPLTCETMPAKCWAKPSCACLLVEVCGSSTAGSCTEAGGGFTVSCMGA